MKIGIITPHFVPNYGAMLQAYALSSHLRSEGVDAEIVDYRQPGLANYFAFKWQFPPPINHWLRLRRCDRFVTGRLPLSPRRYEKPEELIADADRYDGFITGSDQVWFVGPVQYYDPLYFLDFPAPGKRKISYAPSAGGSETFDGFTQRAGESLRQFNHISVRDAHTASLVAPLIGREPSRVVDPVFLSDFKELDISVPPEPEPYLLVFGDLTKGLGPHLQAILDATGLKRVVSLQYPCPRATTRIASPGPEEWLRYFRHAAFVVTTYFHGTAFAVKFQRPFIAIPTPGRRIKVQTLLEGLGLADRCFLATPTPADCAAKATQPIAWSTGETALNAKIADSRRFLREALQS